MRVLAATLAVAWLGMTASAEPAVPDRAKALADRGRQLQHDGHYAEAAEAYKAAYVLAPSSGLVFNLAQAYRLAGNCDDAAWMYHRYLDSQPADDARDIATTHLAQLESCGHTASEPSQPVAPPPSTTTTGRRSRLIGTWLVVGGGGALVVAAVAALDAHNVSNEISDAYGHRGMPTDLRALDERGRRSATIATVFGVTGGLAVISGAILYGIGRHYEAANHVAVIPQPHGASVSLAWGF